MKSPVIKLLALLLFLTILIGSALIMYNKFVASKPKVKLQEHRTEHDNTKTDSLIRNQPGYKR
jgi:hypothetical protein